MTQRGSWRVFAQCTLFRSSLTIYSSADNQLSEPFSWYQLYWYYSNIYWFLLFFNIIFTLSFSISICATPSLFFPQSQSQSSFPSPFFSRSLSPSPPSECITKRSAKFCDTHLATLAYKCCNIFYSILLNHIYRCLNLGINILYFKKIKNCRTSFAKEVD